jgi:hypothetical protein
VSSTTRKSSRTTSGPLRYYAPIQGHELVTRRDLIPSEPDHPRAGNWYYALQLGPLEHKLPPIVANRWRRVTFIVASGDRLMNAHEINDLFERESPVGQLYVRLKELGITVEREWWIDEEGTAYVVDLALPLSDGWLPVTFGNRPGPIGGLHFTVMVKPEVCLREIQAKLGASGALAWVYRVMLRSTQPTQLVGRTPNLCEPMLDSDRSGNTSPPLPLHRRIPLLPHPLLSAHTPPPGNSHSRTGRPASPHAIACDARP